MEWNMLAELEQKVNGRFHIRSIGIHLLLTNAAFDHELLEMPHQSLSVVFNVETSHYVCRSWGREVDRGSFYELDPLVDFCLTLFQKSGCIGITPPDRNFPLSCQFSANCSQFAIGSSRCAACVGEKEATVIKAEDFPGGFEDLLTKEEDEPSSLLAPAPEDMKQDECDDDVKPSDILELLIDTNGNSDIFSPQVKSKRSYVKKPKDEPTDESPKVKKSKKCFKCDLCGAVFGNRQRLWRHGMIEHGKGKFKCHVCNEAIALAVDLLAHIRTTHPGQSTAHCPKCSELIHFDSELDTFPNHYLECVRKSQKKPTSKEVLRLRYLKNQVPCTCDECGKTYTNLNNLKTHQKIHKGLGQVCKDCGYVTSHPSMLSLHMDKHRRERGELETMLCSVCGDPFQGKQSMGHHILSKHKEYTCDECGEKVFGNDNLKAHKASVHLVNKCEVCGVGFPSAYILKRHMEVHIDPMFKCRFCDRMFKRQDGVINHERTHTGETPFACKLCPYVCKSSATLSLHKKFKHNLGKNLKKPGDDMKRKG